MTVSSGLPASYLDDRHNTSPWVHLFGGNAASDEPVSEIYGTGSQPLDPGTARSPGALRQAGMNRASGPWNPIPMKIQSAASAFSQQPGAKPTSLYKVLTDQVKGGSITLLLSEIGARGVPVGTQ